MRKEIYPMLMRGLFEIRDGKRTEFEISLQVGDRTDHLDSRVDSFGEEHNLHLDHKTYPDRTYQVFLISVIVPRGTQPNQPHHQN